MASSNISSQGKTAGESARWPERDRHALTGPSARLDPTRNAVRSDLADIKLADRVFAPNYARELTAVATGYTLILGSASKDGEAIDTLPTRANFRVLEIGREFVWGQAGTDGAVGYVDRNALQFVADEN